MQCSGNTEKAVKEGRLNLKVGWWSCRSMVMLVLVLMMMMDMVSVELLDADKNEVCKYPSG